MFDDDDGGPFVQEALEHLEQGLDVQGMEADGWFIKDKDRISLAFSQFTGQFQPLCLSAGKAGSVFAQSQVAQTRSWSAWSRLDTRGRSRQASRAWDTLQFISSVSEQA